MAHQRRCRLWCPWCSAPWGRRQLPTKETPWKSEQTSSKKGLMLDTTPKPPVKKQRTGSPSSDWGDDSEHSDVSKNKKKKKKKKEKKEQKSAATTASDLETDETEEQQEKTPTGKEVETQATGTRTVPGEPQHLPAQSTTTGQQQPHWVPRVPHHVGRLWLLH